MSDPNARPPSAKRPASVQVPTSNGTAKPKKFTLPANFKPEVSVQAPARRGHAPTVFETPLRNPIERMQTEQIRHTARANLEVQHAERGSIKQDYGPAFVQHVPTRPLTNAEVVHALRSAPGQDVTRQAFAELPAKKSGGGFHLTPAAIVHLPFAALADVPRELTGKGAAEHALTALGADAAKGWETVPGIGHFLGRAAKDAYNVPATALPSLYIPIRETVTGHPGKAAQMVGAPIVQTLEHPIKSFSEHPVSTALIFRGMEGGLSRAAGATGRSGVLGATLKGAADTKRVPLALAGNAVARRSYSLGLIEATAQKAADKRAMSKGRGTVVNEPVVQHVPIDHTYTGTATWHSPHGDHTVEVTGPAGAHDGETRMHIAGTHETAPLHELSATLHGHRPVAAIKATPRQLLGMDASKVPVLPFAGKLNRRVDREYGSQVDAGRQRRDIALYALDGTLPKHGQDAALLINEGVIKSPGSVVRDLGEHLKQLQAEATHLTDPADIAHNAENAAQIEGLLNDKKFLKNPAPAFVAARLYAGTHAVHDAELVHYGDFTAAAAERRVLLPFAHREIPGVDYNHDLGRFERVVQVPVHVAQTVDRETAQLKDALETAKRYGAHAVRIQTLEDELAAATLNSARKALETARANRSEATQIGLPVPTQEIIEAFHAKGGDLSNLAYVPQRSGFRGSSNFNVSSGLRRPGAAVGPFTGASNRAGTYERSFDVLRESLAHAVTRVARHENVTNLVNQFGIKQADGSFFDLRSAQREARAQEAATGAQYVPVTVARQSAPDSLLGELHPANLEQTFRAAEPGDSHVVLMPKPVWTRIREHEQKQIASNAAASGFARTNRLFRHTVLPTSPKWFAGNAVEAYLRMQMHELTPVQVAMTIRAGRRIEAKVRELGGERAVRRLRAAGGTGHFGSQRNLDVNINDASAFMHAAHALRNTPGPEQIVTAWEKARDLVFGANTRMESSVYFYALGKHARSEVREMSGSLVKAYKLAGPAYEDVARGLLDSNHIAEYGQFVDDVRGRYANLSPSGRWATATLLPFAPWYVNAIHFTAMLPVRHPVKTGILTAASQGTTNQRKAFNVPPWAKSDLPLAHGTIPLEHLTPLGVFESGGLAENASQLVLPQYEGMILNELGLTWYGKQLPPGANRQLMTLSTAVNTFTPLAARAQTVLEHGNTAAPDSTIFSPKAKPGSPAGSYLKGLAKAFNPARVINKNVQRKYRPVTPGGPTLGGRGGVRLGTGRTAGGVKLG